MPIGAVVSRPRVGVVVGIPLDGVRLGAMLSLPKSRFGDTWGLFNGVWSPDMIAQEGWAPSSFQTPVLIPNPLLRGAGWRSVGFRPDLIILFDSPSLLLHPSQASFGRSYGQFGLERRASQDRELTKEEAQKRFLLLRGKHHQVLLPTQVIALINEHCLPESERAAMSQSHGDRDQLEDRRPQRLVGAQRGTSARSNTHYSSSWKGFAPAAVIREAEAAVQNALVSLKGKSPAQAARRLSTLVRSFNKLDGTHDFSFGTIERETIMDAVRAIASDSGVEDAVFDDVIDAARDF